ncbi:lamin tail domain-containing protein [Candidatus Saccharibacteria bacterium]|nr:lamin tail domain-containing protein [Candidatus Saccharibacteria bacterium]
MRKFLIILIIIVGSIIAGWGGIIATKAEGIITKEIPEIYIKAVNPGYVVNGTSNVGEMIEIARKNSDTPILLAGLTVGYTNSSGNYSTLLEFPENSLMTGETILLRLASSPEYELAAVNYTKTLAMTGGLKLKLGEKVLDEVCWTGKDDCYKEFKSTKPTTLVRDLETGSFEHLESYEPDYDDKSYVLNGPLEEKEEEEEGEEQKKGSQCEKLRFSEILSYYESLRSEQFIEFYNPSAEAIIMNGCSIRYKNKQYVLKGTIKPREYYVYYPREFSLTKNPTNQNILELIDVDEKVVDTVGYSNGQRKGTAYALIQYDKKGEPIWRMTYTPTPGQSNNYQEFKTCEKGKVINKITGNCVKVSEVKEKVCEEGQYLNPLTDRCKKIEAKTQKTCKKGYYLNSTTGRCRKLETKNKKTCKKGQYLNPLTGRCKKIGTKTKKTCKEGYYLNPETNRCRKMKENSGADYSLVPETYEESSSFTGLYAVIGVAVLGLIYLVYEFRHEIAKLWRRVCRLFH